MCFYCPAAVCGKCFFDGGFATVERNKGFWRHCAKLASLLEKQTDVDSNGVRYVSIMWYVIYSKRKK